MRASFARSPGKGAPMGEVPPKEGDSCIPGPNTIAVELGLSGAAPGKAPAITNHYYLNLEFSLMQG